MRLRAKAILIPLALAGCPAPASPPRAPDAREPTRPPPRDAAPVPMYVIADPDALSRSGALLLDNNSFGAVIDGQRVVGALAGALSVAGGAGDKRRIGKELTSPALNAVDRVPSWLGGGFLFRAAGGLYASETFDGALRPLVSISAGIARVSFGPRGALLRAGDGQRWILDLTTGARAPAPIAGLLDIAALADGRAAALTEGNRVFTSQSRGDHWIDVTGQLTGAPARVLTQPGPGAALELWITDDASHAYRLETDGALREFDQLPSPPPSPIRPRDPDWHGSDSPLLTAVRNGVRLDDGTAVVAENGDIARVDLRTGQLRVIGPGRVPPDLPCEGVRAGDDVVFLCAVPHRPSALISRVLGEEGPFIERTFLEGGPFYVGDDGVIIYGGSCDGRVMRTAACVRNLHGEWQNIDAVPATDGGIEASADGGASEDSIDTADILRWIPRPGGRPLAVLGGASPGTFDPATGLVIRWPPGSEAAGVDRDVLQALDGSTTHGRARIADRSWMATESGELHGWLMTGEGVSISPSGELSRSIYHFPQMADSGAFAFALDKDHRAWQTTDRGERWVEVLAPPRSGANGLHQCSSVGCDLGAWARIGWEATPPLHEVPPPTAPPPPSLPRPPLREIACSPAGDERMASLTTTDAGADAFGLGARRLPMGGLDPKEQPITYTRRFFSRGLVHPTFGRAADDERAVRLLSHGYGAEFTVPDSASKNPFDGITVLGPSRGPEAYRKNLTFLEAFDPSGAVRTSGFGLRDLADPLRPAGMPLGRLFASEGPELDGAIPILPLDPAGPSGYVFTFNSEVGQVVGSVMGGATPRLKIAGIRIVPESLPPVSAAEIAPQEIAVLTVTSDGAEEVYRLSAAGINAVYQLPAPPSTDLAPANPDALAVGPQGALGILRTPSGAEPPSTLDPALLFTFTGGPPQALAPWSTLTAADDPACRADTAGVRAIVTTVSPWIRLKGSAPLASASSVNVGVMAARVRWSAARVCLEAIELPTAPKLLRSMDEIETTIVARFLAPGGAARIGMAPGSELRQPLSCSLLPP